VTQGPTASCRVTRIAKGTDPRRLWIQEEIGCHLQEVVPSCSIGVVQGVSLQEISDPWKKLVAASREMTHCAEVA
jgi:hypothetical protein